MRPSAPAVGGGDLGHLLLQLLQRLLLQLRLVEVAALLGSLRGGVIQRRMGAGAGRAARNAGGPGARLNRLLRDGLGLDQLVELLLRPPRA